MALAQKSPQGAFYRKTYERKLGAQVKCCASESLGESKATWGEKETQFSLFTASITVAPRPIVGVSAFVALRSSSEGHLHKDVCKRNV